MYFSEFIASPAARRGMLVLSTSMILALSSQTAMAQAAQAPAAAPVSNATAVTPTLAATLAPVILARGPAGVVVTSADVMSDLQRAPEETRRAVLSKPDSVTQIVNNLMVRRVLASEAERDGLGNDPRVTAAMSIARDRVLSDARLGRLDAQNAPTEAALDAFARNVYKVEVGRFEVPAQNRVRHILLSKEGADALQKAKDVLAKLRAGASFEELAKASSTDTGSAERGGDLGFFGPGKMVKPFEEATNKLTKPGDLSEPVESQFGYHIIRLEERREKSIQTYEEVRPQLLDEARTSILNRSRVLMVQNLNKDVVVDKAAVEAMTQPVAR